jgi:hypothetical protein
MQSGFERIVIKTSREKVLKAMLILGVHLKRQFKMDSSGEGMLV